MTSLRGNILTNLKTLVEADTTGMSIDYTKFTEVDATGALSIDNATQITATGFTANEVSYIYKDTTVSIDGAFTAKGSWQHSVGVRAAYFGYGDTLDTIDDNTTMVYIWVSGGSVFLLNSSLASSSPAIAVSVDTQYYWTMSRTGSTVSLSIFTDAARTNQVGSTSTVTEAGTFDKVFAISAHDDGSAGTTNSIVYELESATGVSAELSLFTKDDDDLINHVYKEGVPSNAYNNVLELVYSDDESRHEARTVAKTDDSSLLLKAIITTQQARRENNENLYNLSEKFRAMLWANPTLGLQDSGVYFAHVINEEVLINPDDQSIKDGIEMEIEVKVRTNYN